EPIVRHRRMHLGVFQRRGLTVGANEMFFGNKKSGTSAGFPLRRMLEPLRGAIELRCDRRRRGILWRRSGWRDQAIPKLDGIPPNEDGGKEKENPGNDKRDPIVMRLNPFQG